MSKKWNNAAWNVLPGDHASVVDDNQRMVHVVRDRIRTLVQFQCGELGALRRYNTEGSLYPFASKTTLLVTCLGCIAEDT